MWRTYNNIISSTITREISTATCTWQFLAGTAARVGNIKVFTTAITQKRIQTGIAAKSIYIYKYVYNKIMLQSAVGGTHGERLHFNGDFV